MVATSRAPFAQYGAELRHTHVRRGPPSEEIFTRRCEDVNNFRVFRKETFVLDVAGNHCNIALDHRPPIAPYAKIHPALEHPDDEIAEAIRILYSTTHSCAEGAGAAALAALIKERERLHGGRDAVIVSGQNIDREWMHTVLAGGTPRAL